MSKTKEEIVSNIKWALRGGCKRSCSPSDIINDICKCDRDINSLLDEYALQDAEQFLIWFGKQGLELLQDGNWGEPFYSNKYTTSELFTQFKKQQL